MNVTVYGKPNCPQCHMTTRELHNNNIPYGTVDLTTDPEALEYVKSLGHSSAPVVVVQEDEDSPVLEVWSGFRVERIRSLVK